MGHFQLDPAGDEVLANTIAYLALEDCPKMASEILLYSCSLWTRHADYILAVWVSLRPPKRIAQQNSSKVEPRTCY